MQRVRAAITDKVERVASPDTPRSSLCVSVIEECLLQLHRAAKDLSDVLLALGREPGAVLVQLIAEPGDERIKLLVRVMVRAP
jgi:hypothetical protein